MSAFALVLLRIWARTRARASLGLLVALAALCLLPRLYQPLLLGSLLAAASYAGGWLLGRRFQPDREGRRLLEDFVRGSYGSGGRSAAAEAAEGRRDELAAGPASAAEPAAVARAAALAAGRRRGAQAAAAGTFAAGLALWTIHALAVAPIFLLVAIPWDFGAERGLVLLGLSLAEFMAAYGLAAWLSRASRSGATFGGLALGLFLLLPQVFFVFGRELDPFRRAWSYLFRGDRAGAFLTIAACAAVALGSQLLLARAAARPPAEAASEASGRGRRGPRAAAGGRRPTEPRGEGSRDDGEDSRA